MGPGACLFQMQFQSLYIVGVCRVASSSAWLDTVAERVRYVIFLTVLAHARVAIRVDCSVDRRVAQVD